MQVDIFACAIDFFLCLIRAGNVCNLGLLAVLVLDLLSRSIQCLLHVNVLKCHLWINNYTSNKSKALKKMFVYDTIETWNHCLIIIKGIGWFIYTLYSVNS